MKFFVAGLVVLTLSLTALVWQRNRDAAQGGGDAVPPVLVPQGPERTTHCMVWKARRGAAVVWLCGSIHTLRAEDYPLPTPYGQALSEAQRVVMELAPGHTPGAALKKLGTLPAGRTLKDAVSPETWQAVTGWSTRRGLSLSTVEQLKPWSAALTVTHASQKARGYRHEDGVESWFRSRLGDRAVEGLETAESQLGIFDSLSPEEQEKMLALTLSEDAAGITRMERMASAWREGRAEVLHAIMQESFAGMPALQRRLQEERHAAWLPRMEALLAGSETVLVLVGCGHLAGPGSLVDLLKQKGVELEQQTYRTTRIEPPQPAP